MNYPNLFKSRRQALSLSVAHMAGCLNISRQQLYLIESGTCNPSLSVVEKLAQISGPIEILRPLDHKGSGPLVDLGLSGSVEKTENRIEIEK